MTVEKLEVDPQTVQHGVEGLMYLITECSKLMVRWSSLIFTLSNCSEVFMSLFEYVCMYTGE